MNFEGIGAVFYVEHTRHLFPHHGEATTEEEDNLTAAMIPVVYFLVVFSIFVHGLSIPALDIFYRWKKVPPICEEEPTEIRVLSENQVLPNNAYVNNKRKSIIVHNRFSRPAGLEQELHRWEPNRRNSHGSADTVLTHTEDPDFAAKIDYVRRYGGTVGDEKMGGRF